MRGFNGSPAMPPADANFQVFKTSGSFQMPNAKSGIIVDVFGGGGSGCNGASYGGGGGARHRVFIPISALKVGAVYPCVVGAGGVASATNTGNEGGKSAFGSLALGVLIEAYGGGGGLGLSGVGGGGGGAFGAGNYPSAGVGGAPNMRSNNAAITSINSNASSDLGGGNSVTSVVSGSAVWGGGAGGIVTPGASAASSLFGGGGGGSDSQKGAKSGYYGNVLAAFSLTAGDDGILHALQGGAGGGGGGGGAGGFAGGFPSGGGGGASAGTSGKGGDGQVVIYWW